jgi:hypothetical protein
MSFPARTFSSLTSVLLPFVALLSGGCAAGTVRGTVNDEAVPAMAEGGWVEVELFGTPYVQLITTTVPNACETYTAVLQAQEDALAQLFSDFDTDRAQLSFEAAEQDNLPETYWQTIFVVSAADLDAAVGDYDLSESEAGLSVVHVTGYTDWHNYFSTGVAGTQSQTSVAVSGDATVAALGNDRISASGEADLADSASGDAGTVSFKLQGDFCQSYSDLM